MLLLLRPAKEAPIYRSRQCPLSTQTGHQWFRSLAAIRSERAKRTKISRSGWRRDQPPVIMQNQGVKTGAQMVVRRIREHAAHANWFAVGIDVSIVVIGVFLGMQASNWNEERVERQQGASYRARLIEDLRANESDLQQRRDYYTKVRQHGLAALGGLDHLSSPAGEPFLIDSFQATQIIPRALSRFTYDEMIAVGGVDRLGNAQLRTKMKNYYAGLETAETTLQSTPPYREHLRRVMPYAVQQRARARCREILGTAPSGEQRNVLPTSCALDLDPASVAKAVAQVRSSPGITGDLTRHLIDLDLKLDLFDLLEGRARTLRQAMEAQAT